MPTRPFDLVLVRRQIGPPRLVLEDHAEPRIKVLSPGVKVRKELVATLSVLITNLEPSEENYTALQLVVKERGYSLNE